MKNDEKTASRKKKTLFFGGIASVAIFALSRFATPTNVAQTDESDLDARLHPRTYQASSISVRKEIGFLVPELRTYGRAWKMSAVNTRGEQDIHIEVPVIVFTDDLKVTLTPQNGGASTRVEVRSASRVGKGDFGENRRHIIQFLAALDARLR